MVHPTISYRSYTPEDKDRLVEIFRSNCPKYFDPADEEEFIDFLDNYTDENYLVAFSNGIIVGCGRHYRKGEMYGIAWGMFESGSIGSRRILQVADDFYYAMEGKILAENTGYPIRINTTQLMEKMFNRYGFKTYEILLDGFGNGLDEYRMEKRFSQD